MSTHNLCFEQKYEKYQNFLPKNFHFLVGKFSVNLNRRVFVMNTNLSHQQGTQTWWLLSPQGYGVDLDGCLHGYAGTLPSWHGHQVPGRPQYSTSM